MQHHIRKIQQAWGGTHWVQLLSLGTWQRLHCAKPEPSGLQRTPTLGKTLKLLLGDPYCEGPY